MDVKESPALLPLPTEDEEGADRLEGGSVRERLEG